MKYSKWMISVTFILFVSFSFAQKADFTGKWMINESKSDFAGLPNATMFKGVNVIQTKDSLLVAGIRFNTDGQPGAVTGYPLNGNTIESKTPGRTMKASLAWSVDGKIITRNSAYEFDSGTGNYQSKEEWALADGGKTLVLTRQFTGMNGDRTIKAVYEKQ